MKNRMPTRRRKKNGKFFCRHHWEVIEEVGPDWDIIHGVKVVCRCSKCGKVQGRPNYSIKEIPDEMINRSIQYTG